MMTVHKIEFKPFREYEQSFTIETDKSRIHLTNSAGIKEILHDTEEQTCQIITPEDNVSTIAHVKRVTEECTLRPEFYPLNCRCAIPIEEKVPTRYKELDYDKLRSIVEEKGWKNVSAGILEDWGWTVGTVVCDGVILDDTDAWVSSTWGTPGIMNVDTECMMPCWKIVIEED